MNKTEFIKTIAEKTGLSKKDAEITLSYEGACGFRIYDPLTGEITEVESTTTIKSFRALFVQPLFPEE